MFANWFFEIKFVANPLKITLVTLLIFVAQQLLNNFIIKDQLKIYMKMSCFKAVFYGFPDDGMEILKFLKIMVRKKAKTN